MKIRYTIGFRLTLWYLTIFLCTQAAFGLGMWLILRHNLYDIADDALEAQVDDLQHFLRAHDTSDLQKNLGNQYGAEHWSKYLIVADEQGNLLYRGRAVAGSGSLPLDAGQLRQPLYEDRKDEAGPVRSLTESLNINGHRYIVQVGTDEDDVLATLVLFRHYLSWVAPLLVLVASAGGYWLSQRALAPVDLITQTARSITGSNLSSRLERLHTGDELQRLSDTLNDMLARLEVQFQRVSQFTADASHELRTPIALIRTEAEIALRKPRNAVEYQDALRHILLEAEKTSGLIETLLSLARADAGKEALQMKPLDLRELSRKSAGDWAPRIAAENLQLAEELGKTQLMVVGDEPALRRLLDILLDNAVKYTPAPGKIEFSLSQAGRSVILKIKDTGIGVSQEDQPRIFERFYRADKARTREARGAGLGLAIAEWIVRQHRGSITLESAPGKGSTFTVGLPV